MMKNDPELLEIQKQGFISAAIDWLNSTRPERMKYGTATKQDRLDKAREFAAKAETTVEALARKHNLDL